MNVKEIMEFYENTWKQGQDILRLILDDKEQYIKNQKNQLDPSIENGLTWSDLTLLMSKLNNQAWRLYVIMKHSQFFSAENQNQLPNKEH
tara:strand:+ start:2092 stop:2361 length:270 start_codon:yes stop_codon:yes gene_type:complete